MFKSQGLCLGHELLLVEVKVVHTRKSALENGGNSSQGSEGLFTERPSGELGVKSMVKKVQEGGTEKQLKQNNP